MSKQTIFQLVSGKKYVHSNFFDFALSRNYVGKGNGVNGSEYSYHYDTTHPKLKPTQTINKICVYCGSQAKHIQANLRSDGYGFRFRESWEYDTTDYYCTCVDAAAEYQANEEIEALKAKFNEEISKIWQSMPRVSHEVISLAKSDYDVQKLFSKFCKAK